MEHLVESIIRLDQKLFFLLNGAHCEFLDTVMKVLSAIPVWIPLYLMIAGGFFMILPGDRPCWPPGHIAYVPAHRPDLFLPDKKLGTKAQTIAYPEWEGTFRLLEGKRRSLFIRLVTRQQRFWAGVLYQLDIQKKMVYHSHSHLGDPRILQPHLRGQTFSPGCDLRSLTGLLLGWAVYELYKWIITKTVTKCAA